MKKNVLLVLVAAALVFSFSMSSALYAKDTAEEKESKDKCPYEGYYFCPKEDCTYKSKEPGKCPDCGLELKKHEHKTVYVCPMKQCNVKSDKPGKCPKCGMELKEKTVCNCEGKAGCKEHHKQGHEHKHDHKHDH